MKAILVIDMPKDCASGCPVMCRTRGINHRPTWCPLKPMPSKRKSMVEWIDAKVKTHDLTEYDKGWNACVEFIEGENNNG